MRSPAPRAKFSVALVLLAAFAAALALLSPWSRRPAYLKGEAGRTSPVLKPTSLEGRSFFLHGNRYLLRLGPEAPVLRWKLERAAKGDLEVTLHIAPKGKPVPSFGFSVTLAAGAGPRKTLFSETWETVPVEGVVRRIKAALSASAGDEFEFCLSSDALPGPDVLDAGITVPRVPAESAGPPPSHLLIISIDALRRDALGIYQTLAGRPPDLSLSPELDRFAEDAIVFTNARTTQSSTWPALSSLFLSAYPRAHGVTENRTFLEAPGGSIATLLRGLGYATFALGANAIALNLPGFEEKRQYFRADDRLLAAGRRKIAEQAANPFFHWYHLFGCHDNYAPPEWVMKIVARDVPGYVHRRISTNDMMRGKAPSGPDDVALVRRLYGGALYYVDSLLKETFDDLKKRGLWNDTLIIVTADHGEELFEHHGYFHHKPSLYDGALRVPLLIKFPGQRGRRVVRENVSHIDLLPTIHHYFAGRPRAGLYEGLSLLDLLAGKKRAFAERILFAETEDSKVVAAILGNHKLIHNPSGIVPRTPLGQPFPMGPVEFYDLEADPGETRNLAGIDVPVLRRLLIESGRYIHAALEPKAKRGDRGGSSSRSPSAAMPTKPCAPWATSSDHRQEGARPMTSKTLKTLAAAVATAAFVSGFAASTSCRRAARSPRVYVIGLDGATWDVIDPLIEQGKLPVFKELKESGAWARLRTFDPTLSAVVWTSIATGKTMIKHGIVDWTYVNKQNIKVPYSSSEKRVPSIWEMMDEHGLRSIVLNWFVTYPPDAVRGVVVSDSFSAAALKALTGKGDPGEFADTVYPPKEFTRLYDRLSGMSAAGAFRYPRLIEEMKLPDYLAEYRARYSGDPGRVPILSVWPSFLAYDRIQDALVDHYLEENDHDLFLAYYRFPDVFFHFATLFLEKAYHDRIDAYVGAPFEPTPEVLSEFNRMMAGVAEPLLREKEIMLAKVLDRVRKENAYLLVVSDHGFQMSSKGYTHYGLPSGTLPPDGILALLGPGVKPGVRIEASVYDIAPTILYLKGLPVGADMDGKPLFEALASPKPVRTALYTRMKHQAGERNTELDEKKLEELKSLGYIK